MLISYISYVCKQMKDFKLLLLPSNSRNNLAVRKQMRKSN